MCVAQNVANTESHVDARGAMDLAILASRSRD